MNNGYEVIGKVNGVEVIRGSTWKCKDGLTGQIIDAYGHDFPLSLIEPAHGVQRTFTKYGSYRDDGGSVYDLKELVMNPPGYTATTQITQEETYSVSEIEKAFSELDWQKEGCKLLIEKLRSTAALVSDPEWNEYIRLKEKFENN